MEHSDSHINKFFEQPILNSPYEIPRRHWELDDSGQPTHRIIERRRSADFITPVPKPKKRVRQAKQQKLDLDNTEQLEHQQQQYELASRINEVRKHVSEWRSLPRTKWKVTAETARLLDHWRNYAYTGIRPFFCQIEAVETAIWLTEVAPQTSEGKRLLDEINAASQEANPELLRLSLKLATGAGKTTVMAMIIVWQTINAVRRPTSKNFSKGFLIVAPGLTVRDRLRVLKPNDPDNYYVESELVPTEMLADLQKAKVVITNYHAFKLRERLEISKGGRRLLQGRTGTDVLTKETEGQMIQRVMPELMGLKNILVLNDEAHHCYREKPGESDEDELKGDDKKEAEENNEAARLWISGLETVHRKLGLTRVIDLSATPFFLRGSGYVEGSLFPWTVSDFSLMDAIESGIVKLPRVPVAENISGNDMPMYRNLWETVGKDLPRSGRAKSGSLDPLKLPVQLISALEALYGHYEKTFYAWMERGLKTPPCFIIVCQNTAISKLVYDYVSGFERVQEDGTTTIVNGRLPLFRNYDGAELLARPNTLLVDSVQLERGEGLDDSFRKLAAGEIERFRREKVERTGTHIAADAISDSELLREVLNTVGKQDQLGASIRCVVSVSMLTEGWDARNVTHILGIRAFGTQLLCEQVVGRALRRQSYDLIEEGPNKGLFNIEYADVFGIPFDFNAKPVVSPPQPPRETIEVRAVRPDRDALEIVFPRVEGYRRVLPVDELQAHFTEESRFVLSPELVGPTITHNSGIIGEGVDLTLDHIDDVRLNTVVYSLTKHLLNTKLRDAGEEPKLHLFGQVKNIARQWLDHYVEYKGNTFPGHFMYMELAEMACERITSAIMQGVSAEAPIKALLDPYNPLGSTRFVRFNTSKTHRYETDPRKCHINWVILDSDWEAEFCRVAEAHPRVLAYVKNHGLGFEVPYQYGSESRRYRPDFIVLVDDGHGADDPLNLIVEIKGYRGEDAKEKKSTMDTYWIPGVNNLGTHGRWAFAEFTEIHAMERDFKNMVETAFQQLVEGAAQQEVP